MVIQHNMASLGIQRQRDITNKRRSKSSERLASGYRVNRASDDAAALSISEKMRGQIRGLERASANAVDGMSWIQAGEGALNEVAAILHRMRELTTQSLNDTNTDADRNLLQMEFDQLQSEIDNIGKGTKYNSQNVFAEHEPTYYSVKGNKLWNQSQLHNIVAGNNDSLTVKLLKSTDDPSATPEEVTITVPPGRYTTQELMDEIDDAMIASGAAAKGLNLEYTDKGLCNLNYEGGEDIVSLSGGLSYLFYNSYDKGSLGALLGTTEFAGGNPLRVTNENNELEFTLVNFYNEEKKVQIELDPGYYTRERMIQILNDELIALGLNNVEAKEYGASSIQITSEDYYVTGLKGNMFKIDDPSQGPVYTSVFYDNIKDSSIKETAAVFKGGAVLVTGTTDTDHNRFVITNANNQLVLRANGSDYVTITLANGTYDASGMASHLSTKLASLGLTATYYGEGGFYGLQINSTVKGVNSKIEFDVAGSSAYNTLFRECEYATIRSANAYGGSYSYGKPYVWGGVTFSSDAFPLVIEAGVNDRFNLSVGNAAYEIKLKAGTYNSLAELLEEIDDQINGDAAPSGLKGKLTVTSSEERIYITPVAVMGSEITSVKVSKLAGNAGYEALFVGTKVNVTHNAISNNAGIGNKPKITLDFTNLIGQTIDDSNDTLTLTVDGKDIAIQLDHGEITDATAAAIAQKITDGIQEKTDYQDKSFNTTTGTGTDKNQTVTGTGGTRVDTTFNQKVTGTGVPQQGSTNPDNLKPASYVIPWDLDASTTIISGKNDTIVCDINGKAVTVTLDAGTYSREQLKDEIQKQFDIEAPEFDGVDVELSGNRLKFTTKLSGVDSSVHFYSTGGTFMVDLCTTEVPAVASITNVALKDSITIDASNRAFAFQLNGSTVEVQLTAKTYNTRAEFIAELNAKLTSLGVMASLNSYNSLQLTTTGVGTGNSIKLDTETIANNPDALFANLTSKASVLVSEPIQSSITIDGSSNQFALRLEGQYVTVTLDSGTYTSDELVAQLNTKLAGKATVTIDSSKRLTFTSEKTGSGSAVYLNSSTMGNSMSAIFGRIPIVTSGVGATASNDGKKLDLEGSVARVSGTTRSLSVSSSKGSANLLFVKPTYSTPITVNPTQPTGSLTSTKAYIQGVALNGSVTIDSLNKQLSFRYMGYDESITLEEKTYTYDELQTALQGKVDAAVGSNQINVTVAASGVRLEAVTPGSSYNMTYFSGGFYRYVMSGSTVNSTMKNVTYAGGTQTIDPAYAIGRQDVRNNAVQIIKGSNDELSVDLTIGSTVHTLNMVLDAGTYQGNSLASQIQTKLNEALIKEGLQPNLVKASIGGFNSGVTGANDSNSLVFSLSTDYVLNASDVYTIDGVSGSASFYVFYKTDGSPIPSYIQGSHNISKGVTIGSDDNTFSFVANGTTYEYEIPEGDYTAEEIVDKLNELIQSGTATEPDPPPIVAMLSDGNLKLSFTTFGNNAIHSVSGLAKGTLFYAEEGQKDGVRNTVLQIGANANQTMSLEKPRMTTVGLGINSVVITKPKYANKALDRLDKALDQLLSSRSYYGAAQNRLGHIKAGNDNTAENLQASESRLRDLDMAKEMVALSKNMILLQASEAMLAQANQSTQGILQLLK